MRLYDILMAMLIIGIFAFLIGHKTFSVQVQNVSENWPKHRCNPLFMPFASDPIGNFNYCIQQAQREYMDYLLTPVTSSLSVMNGLGAEFNDALQNVRKMFHYIRSMFGDIIGKVFGVFLNLIIEFQKTTMGIKDMVGKMMGVMVSLIYMVDGSVKTAEATWNGPPGKLIRGLCFDKHTLIQKKDGTMVSIYDINVGTILKDGSEVVGKLELNNLNDDGSFRSDFVRFPRRGEDCNTIYVTEHHFVKSKDGKWIYAKDHPDAVVTKFNYEKVYCLITNTREIHIGEYVFHDWEDNDAMYY